MVDFIELLSKNDVEGYQGKISALLSELPEDVVVWDVHLVSLTLAVEQHYHHNTLMMVLKSLPAKILEAFFVRLVASDKLTSDCISTLTEFILARGDLTDEHSTGLIRHLLWSPYEINNNQLTKLASQIEPRALGALLLELRQQAASKIVDVDISSLQKSKRSAKDHYQKKYEILLMTLSIQASRSAFFLPEMIQDKPCLANLIIICRMKHAKNDGHVTKIINDLFVHGHCYNWQDPNFKQVVLPRFIEVLAKSEQQDVVRLFKQYDSLAHKNQPSIEDKVRLLDKLFSLTQPYSIERLTACIQAINDRDHSFTINFLTRSSLNNFELTEALLSFIPLNDLPRFTAHMQVVGQGAFNAPSQVHLFENFIFLFCQRLKASADPTTALSQLAEICNYLPESNQKQLINHIDKQLVDSALIQGLWLKESLLKCENKSVLLPFCYTYIVAHADNDNLVLPLLQALPSKDLLKLFVYLLQKQAPTSTFQCFHRLFTDEERLPQLFYLVTHTPVIPKELLLEFVMLLHDKTLITLIDELLIKTDENSEFTTTLNQVLFLFCQRLAKSIDKNHAIHQWVLLESSSELAIHILENPDCVYELSLTSSIIWRWVSWSSDVEALRLRINQVLNDCLWDDPVIDQIVRSWLIHFQFQPEKLQTIFSNLENTDESREKIAKTNYLNIKKSCWRLLAIDGDYSDDAFKALIPSISQHQTFDPFLQKLANEHRLADKPAQAAKFLSLTTDSLPSSFTDEQLLPILIHSVHEDCLNNWQKAEELLNRKTEKQAREFFQKLIAAVILADFNPVLVSRAYDLLVNTRYIEVVLKNLSEPHLSWVLRNSSVEQLKESFPRWLDWLIAHHGLEGFNLAKLLILLPQKEDVMGRILTRKELEAPEALARLFVQLANEQGCDALMVGLHKKFIAHDAPWLKSFLKQVLAEMDPQTANVIAVHVLNASLLTISKTLNVDSPEDQHLLLQQLTLLNGLIEQAETDNIHKECRQLMLNLLTQFNKLDRRWARFTLQADAVTNIIISWLKSMNLTTQTVPLNQHPLLDLLLDNLGESLPRQLTEDYNFQYLIKLLLENPSPLMTADHYLFLFKFLSADFKTELVQMICERHPRHPIQSSVLPMLGEALAIDALYDIYTKDPSDFLIIKTLFNHDNLFELPLAQRHQLIDGIESANQLLQLLDSYATPEKCLFLVEQIYDSCQGDWINLAEKFARWGITSSSMAALANFTVADKNKNLLQALFQQRTFYLDFIDNYIRAPDLDMQLQEGSYLKDRVYKTLINPDLTSLCDASFLAGFDAEFIFQTMSAQFEFSKQWQTLSLSLQPLKENDDVLQEAVAAARWTLSLPLYTSGLLYIYDSYSNSEFRDSILETDLFKTIIKPLFGQGLKSSLGEMSSKLPKLLINYAQEIPVHESIINPVLSQYLQKLGMIKNFLPPRVFDFFNPENKPGALVFSRQDKALLASASDEAFEIDQKKGLSGNFAKIFAVAVNDRDLMNNDQFKNWLFREVFISPLSASIDRKDLSRYLQLLTPEKWQLELEDFYHRQQQITAGLDLLIPLDKMGAIHSAFEYLSQFDGKQLLDLVLICNNMNLIHLSNIVRLVFYTKKTGLSASGFMEDIFPVAMDNGLNFEWLLQDVARIDSCKQFLQFRYQEMVSMAFAHTADNCVEERLLLLREANDKYLSADLVIKSLESYRPLFASKTDARSKFTQGFETILKTKDKGAGLFINAIQGDLVLSLISEAIKEPNTYQALLHFCLNSNFKDYCQKQLSQALAQMLGQNDPEQLMTLERLSEGQWTQKQWIQITSILRLLAIASPDQEFAIVNEINFLPDSPYQKQAFIADISTFHILSQLKKQTQHNELDSGIEWLKHQSREGDLLFSYLGILNSLMMRMPGKFPLACYHWFTWQYELDDKPLNLIGGFLIWLAALDEHRLQEDNPELKRLFLCLADNQLIEPLCGHMNSELNIMAHHKRWLAKAIASLQPFQPEHLNDILSQCSTSCLEELMPTITQQSLSSWTIDELRDLLEKVDDKKYQTSLVIHLLGREDYLNRLQGRSFLNQISTTGPHQPPRLQPILQLLDNENINLLTVETIRGLTAEAAVSCLFSVRHFHLWTVQQVDALLNQYPKSEVIHYWFKHYALMPNAINMMTNAINMMPHWINLADSHVVEALNKIEPEKKRIILKKIIGNLTAFDSLNGKLVANSDESHLRLAIDLYCQGQDAPIYVKYIKALAHRLIKDKKHQFSPEAVACLISLQDKPSFDDLNYKLAFLSHDYLRAAAESANSDYFYEDDVFNFSRTQIQLSPQVSESETKLWDIFKPAQSHFVSASNTASGKDEQDDYCGEITNNKAIYFYLRNYKGKGSVLNRLLADFLNHYQYGEDSNLDELQCFTALLLPTSKVSEKVKNAIFTALKAHPALLKDPQISHDVFKYNADEMIKTLGQAQKYKTLISICDGLLKHPSLDNEIANKVKIAKAHAEFEQKLKKMKGPFLALRRWIKRCNVYGWQGFFVPNPSPYVAAFDAIAQTDQLPRDVPAHRNPRLTADKALEVVEQSGYYKHIYEALGHYNFCMSARGDERKHSTEEAQNELKLRNKIDYSYDRLLKQSASDAELMKWLSEHQECFIENRHCILQLVFKEGDAGAMNQYMERFAKGPGDFDYIKAEFDIEEVLIDEPQLPQQVPQDLKARVKDDLNTVANGLIDGAFAGATRAAGLAQYYLSWLPQHPQLEAAGSAQAPANQHRP